MDTATALAVLADALERCRRQDMRTATVYAALAFLETRAAHRWPLDQFRAALEDNDDDEEGRWQIMNASFNGIQLAVMPNPNRSEPTSKREWVFEPGLPKKRG
jgi:hypothetical protein